MKYNLISVARPQLTGNEKRYVNECLDEVRLSSGRFVTAFEESFAAFCGTSYAVSCNSGTSALQIALQGLGVKPGDEVIIPILTFAATANVVRQCGATPVLVDSESRTMALDPAQLESRITS